MVRQAGFFDVEDRLRELSAKGDDLERIAALVDFALFRPELERAVPRADGTKGGRPAFDHVLMFKILLLQAMHGLSDERCEYLIKDRLSFMRFLGLGLADPVPDAAGQCSQIRRALGGRTCLCPAEGPDGLDGTYHWPGQGEGEDRPRQSRLQHQAPRLAQQQARSSVATTHICR